MSRHKRFPPLTEDQRALVAAQAEWLPAVVKTTVPPFVLRRVGVDECVAEGWRLVMFAATSWRPDGGASFRTYAHGSVKRFLRVRLARTYARNRRVWREMPVSPGDGRPLALELADHRARPGPDPLAIWAEGKAQRRWLDMRTRVVMYLRYVEGWNGSEIGRELKLSRERVSQFLERGRELLAVGRIRDGLCAARAR